MLSFLGNSFVVIAIALTFIIVHQAFKKVNTKENYISKSIVHLSLIQCTLFIISFLTLILSFIFSDFSLITVFQKFAALAPDPLR